MSQTFHTLPNCYGSAVNIAVLIVSEKIELKVRYIVLYSLSLSFIDTLRLASNVEEFY